MKLSLRVFLFSTTLFLIFGTWLVACQPISLTPTATVDSRPNSVFTREATLPEETPAPASDTLGAWPISPDQKLMVAQSSDGAWWMWNASTRQPVYLLNDRTMRALPMHHPKFSSDGHYLAAISMGHVLLWEIASRKRLSLMPPTRMDRRSLRLLAFSPDSHLLASNGCEQQGNHMMCIGGFVNLWNTNDGTLARTLAVGFRIEEMTYSSDGKTLTVAGCSRTDGGMGSNCYEHSEVSYDLNSGDQLTLTRVPQYK